MDALAVQIMINPLSVFCNFRKHHIFFSSFAEIITPDHNTSKNRGFHILSVANKGGARVSNTTCH